MEDRRTKKVYLIGGPPGAGKTTLGTALAIKLGITSLSIDDLITAVQAVTTPETHPGLHLMWQTSHYDYFTNSTIEQLKTDAIKQHEATWPFIKQVIRKHALRGPGIVIDGWYLWPGRVAQLELANVCPNWIVMAPAVLEAREKQNMAWTQHSTNPEKMLQNFLARSLWFNDLIQEQATELQMNILYQSGTISVDELCMMILERWD